jgi:signal transduction histidine kinase
MKSNITFRIFAFAALIVLLALLIGGAAHYGWQQFEGLRSHLSMTPLASFRSADQFRATIEELDYLLLRYSLQHDESDWNTFLPTSTNLDRWIDEQKVNLTTLQEQQLWDKINFLYDDYQEAARNLRKHRLNPQLPSDERDFAKVEDASRRMMDVAFQLAGAHQQSMELFVSQFEHSLAILRRLIFGALFALLVLGLWLSLVVYRDMIAPLRRQLVESQTIIERQEKLASLGVLAAGVAHEIRNPLTAIKARLFTQQKLLSAGTPELEDSVVIGNEINRLEKIVRDVLQFARPADPKLMKVDAATPLREARDLLAPQLQKRGIALNLGTIADVQVSADPDQIKQVLINLIQNAAESIDENGTVTLSAQCDTRRLHGQPQSTVILEVSDTGKGMSPEIQKRLFDPFFSTKETGTGLGLTIAARIIEKHGGALEFRTQVNRGTAFGIVLPRV